MTNSCPSIFAQFDLECLPSSCFCIKIFLTCLLLILTDMTIKGFSFSPHALYLFLLIEIFQHAWKLKVLKASEINKFLLFIVMLNSIFRRYIFLCYGMLHTNATFKFINSIMILQIFIQAKLSNVNILITLYYWSKTLQLKNVSHRHVNNKISNYDIMLPQNV